MLFDGDLVDSQTVGLNSEGAGYVVFLKRVLEWGLAIGWASGLITQWITLDWIGWASGWVGAQLF